MTSAVNLDSVEKFQNSIGDQRSLSKLEYKVLQHALESIKFERDFGKLSHTGYRVMEFAYGEYPQEVFDSSLLDLIHRIPGLETHQFTVDILINCNPSASFLYLSKA